MLVPYDAAGIVAELERYGVTHAHLLAVLRFFQCHTPGSVEWYVDSNGRLVKLHFHAMCSAKPYEVNRVSNGLYDTFVDDQK